MKKHTPRLAVPAVLASVALLAGCVTNSETGHPEGWQPILPEPDPEVVAFVPENIAAKGTISIGTNPPFAPFQFKDSHGNIIGVEMDLAAATASIMGLDLQIVQQEFALILPAVDAGTLDFGASGFTDTEERRERYDFIDTFFAGIQWAQRVDGPAVDPENACGLTVAVQRNTVPETDDLRPKNQACIDEGKEEIEILSYETADQAATALVVGRADAFVADSPVTAWTIERADGQLEETGQMYDAAPYGYASPKGSQLTAALAAAFQKLVESGDYQRIMDQWNISSGLVDQSLINEVPYKEFLAGGK